MNPYELKPIYGKLNTIAKVDPDSIAEELGIEAGDMLLEINGNQVRDVIDYRYHIGDENILLTIEKRDGELWEFDIEKEFGEDLGLHFEQPLLDRQKTCSNACTFCFIDQMPPNMRDTLYIKDDDSRLSFLQGNYITLTNMSREDFQRMIDYRLSPVNVSIHTSNPELRISMLKNKRASEVLDSLRELTSAGIDINGQIVLIPGVNDGSELDQTLKDLDALRPHMHSVAIVPVGLTKYRDGLAPLNCFTKDEAREVIKQVEAFSNQSRSTTGEGFAYLSDEFYLIAEQEVPEEAYYDGYPQFENGVGLIRSFKNEAQGAIHELVDKDLKLNPINLGIVTGEYASPMIKEIADQLMREFPALHLTVYTVKNNFFGEDVKVTGLLTGTDLIDKLKSHGETAIMVPRTMFRSDELITLDDYYLDELEDKLKTKIIPVANQGKLFVGTIIKEAMNG